MCLETKTLKMVTWARTHISIVMFVVRSQQLWSLGHRRPLHYQWEKHNQLFVLNNYIRHFVLFSNVHLFKQKVSNADCCFISGTETKHCIILFTYIFKECLVWQCIMQDQRRIQTFWTRDYLHVWLLEWRRDVSKEILAILTKYSR